MSAEPTPVVLVADDSLVVRALLRAQLRDRGYEVIEAANGEQALTVAAEQGPDVILLDIEMPRLDGFGALERLKADPDLSSIPVVLITGRTTAADTVRGLELGAHDYLRKPFEAAELAARVHGALRTKRLQDDLRTLNVELTRQACTDNLTGLPNRRFLDEQLDRLCSRAARHGTPLGVMVVDADDFKRVNDERGHLVGDEALVALGKRLSQRLRAEDVLGRWGGEEFMILAPDTDAAGIATLAETLRCEVVATPITIPGGEVALSVSIGWAVWNDDAPAELLQRADAALYAAKAGGRNVVVGPDGQAPTGEPRNTGSTRSP